jgi:hypothetical protein
MLNLGGTHPALSRLMEEQDAALDLARIGSDS